MHSFIAPSGRTYLHSGNFTGDIEVQVDTTHQGGLVAIPFEDIRAIYLESLRRQEIEELEAAEYHELETRFMP